MDCALATLRAVLALVALGSLALAADAAAVERTPFRVVVFGDSYGAGEGAPGIPGHYADDGTNPDPRADWNGTADDVAFTGDTQEGGVSGARRCHRSPRATAAVAVRSLISDFPDLEISFRSFACSGARVEKGVTGPYLGAEEADGTLPDSDDEPVPPQIEQANTYLATLPDGTRRIDALVLNIGGNNLGFGDIIARCHELPAGFNPCSPPDASFNGEGSYDTEHILELGEGISEPKETSGLDDLPAMFGILSGGLVSSGSGLHLSAHPRHVFQTGVPNPLAGGFAGCASLTGQYDYENRLRADERTWLINDVFPRVNGGLSAAGGAHGWTFVPLDSAVPTGMCASANRMINRNRDSLPVQGATIASAVGLGISHGWVHPNADGYAAMAPLLAAQLHAWIITRFTPSTKPASTTGPAPVVELRPRVQLQIDPAAPVDFPTRAAGQFLTPVGSVVLNDIGSARVDVPIPPGDADTASMRAQTCGPLGADTTGAPRGCSPPYDFGLVRIGTPKPPASTSSSADPLGFKVSWTKGSTVPLRRFLIDVHEHLRLSSGIEPTQAIVESPDLPGAGPQTGHPHDLTPGEVTRELSFQYSFDAGVRQAIIPAPRGASVRVSVRECTDRGCSEPNGAGDTTAGGLLTNLHKALSRTVVRQQMVHFPIGVFTMRTGLGARAGRVFPLLVSWGTWRNWRDLRDLRLRLRGPGGVLAGATFELGHGLVTLVPARGRPRTGRAGQRRTLRAGAVSMPLAGARLHSGGPGSRLVAVRLPLRLGRALRGQRIDVDIGATDRHGHAQALAWAGSFVVRR